jgi:hypothetical protein
MPSTSGAQSLRGQRYLEAQYFGAYHGSHAVALHDVSIPGHSYVLAVFVNMAATGNGYDVISMLKLQYLSGLSGLGDKNA